MVWEAQLRAGFVRAAARVSWLLAVMIAISARAPAAEPGVFNVRDYGAAGDGETLDTPAINKAIEACAAAGGGQVLFPPGRYLSGTVHLKSHVTLFLEAGARWSGPRDLDLYQHPTPPAFMPEARWGKWHRALDPRRRRGGYRDRRAGRDRRQQGLRSHRRGADARAAYVRVSSIAAGVTIRDVSFVDSANYAIFFQVSDQVEIRNVKITGGWDGVHFRGCPGRPCRDVSIVGCQFFTGR